MLIQGDKRKCSEQPMQHFSEKAWRLYARLGSEMNMKLKLIDRSDDGNSIAVDMHMHHLYYWC